MPPPNLRTRCLSVGLATVWLGAARTDAPAQVIDYDQESPTTFAPKKATKKKAAFKKTLGTQSKKTRKTRKTTEHADLVRRTVTVPDFDPMAATLEFEEELVLDAELPVNFLFTNIWGLVDSDSAQLEGDSSIGVAAATSPGGVAMLFDPATAATLSFGTTTWSNLFTSDQAAIATAIDTGDANVLSDFLFESSSVTGVFAAVPSSEGTVVPNALQGVLVGFDPVSGVASSHGFAAFDAEIVPEPGGALLMVGGMMLAVSPRRRRRRQQQQEQAR